MLRERLRKFGAFIEAHYKLSKNLGIFASFLMVAFVSVYLYSPVEKSQAEDWNRNTTNSAFNIAMAGDNLVEINAVPTNTQQIFSGNHNLSLSTTCPYGATVTLASDSETSNALTRTGSDSGIKVINATTNASSLSNNSWGYSINDGLNYYAVPLKNATPATIYTSSHAETITFDVRYGVKLDTTIPGGAYSTTVVYTLSPDRNCLSYELVFDTNGGTPINTQRITYGSLVDLSSFVTTKEKRYFDGWEVVGESTTYTGSETGVNLNPTNKISVTLKAKWKEDILVITELQDIDPTHCLNTTTPLPTATQFDWDGSHHGDPNYVPRTIMTDTRDGKTYLISKLADGNCWMSQNLAFDLSSNVALTSDDSDLIYKGSWTPTNTTQTTTNITWPSNPTSDARSYHPAESESFYRGGNTKASSPTQVTDRGDYNWESAGNYYNWPAAIAGESTSQTMNDSICPKGWRLPSETGNRSYENLMDVYGLSQNSVADAAKLIQNPLNYVLNGFYNPSSMSSQGTIAGLWTSTPGGNTGTAVVFGYTNSSLNTNQMEDGGIGYSIRCVSPSRYLVRFVDTDGDIIDEIEIDEGERINLTEHAPTKQGHIFKRWHSLNDDTYFNGTETSVDVNPNRDVLTVLQAEWQQTVWDFDFTEAPQTFTAPQAGNYKLEVWGAQGESWGGGVGGYGGYATGEYTLAKDANLYVYTGGTGLDYFYSPKQGYNGGGYCYGALSYRNGNNYASGGGGTDIRTSINSNYEDRIIVAGGGGGGSGAGDGVSVGYGGGGSWYDQSGGAGGGVIRMYEIQHNGAVGGNCGITNGNCSGLGSGTCSSSNYDAYGTAAGGGGYVGGNGIQTSKYGATTPGWNAWYASVGAGGTSYVGGVTNGQMIAGNAEMPVHREMTGLTEGQTTIIGNRTNGHARITLILE